MTDALTAAIAEALRPVVREELAAALAAARGPAQEPDRLLGITEVARLLNCSARSVRRHVSVGRLRSVKLGDGGSSRLLFARSEVERLIRDA